MKEGEVKIKEKDVGKDVLLFVFVSHHPNLCELVICEISFPQVKSVLPMMASDLPIFISNHAPYKFIYPTPTPFRRRNE